MHRLTGYLLIALALGFVATASHATDYYVAQGVATAADTNPGTEAKPFLTIGGALKAVAARLGPGDTLRIKEGVYRERISLRAKDGKGDGTVIASGASYNRAISFAGVPGDHVVLSGSDVVTGLKPFKEDIWVQAGWEPNSQQVFVDGKPLEQIGGKMSEIINFWGWKHKGKGLDDMIPGSFYYS